MEQTEQNNMLKVSSVGLRFFYELEKPLTTKELADILNALTNEHKQQNKVDTELVIKEIRTGSLEVFLEENVQNTIALAFSNPELLKMGVQSVLDTGVGKLFESLGKRIALFGKGKKEVDEYLGKGNRLTTKECENVNQFAGKAETVIQNQTNIFINGEKADDLLKDIPGVPSFSRDTDRKQLKAINDNTAYAKQKLKEAHVEMLYDTDIEIYQIRKEPRTATGDRLVVDAIEEGRPRPCSYEPISLKEELLEHDSDKFSVVIRGDVRVEYGGEKPRKYVLTRIDEIVTM